MFKIGDRIRCVRALKGHKLTVGDFYTIYHVSISFSETYVYVEEHRGYMFDENRFVLAEEEVMFKIGDEVISKHYGNGSIVEIDVELDLRVIFEDYTYARWFLSSGQNRTYPENEDLSIELRNKKKPAGDKVKLKVGDIVECNEFGRGTVNEKFNEGEFEILFNDGDAWRYNSIGQFRGEEDSPNKTLKVIVEKINFEFKVGDIVEFGGLEGVVNVVSSGETINYPLECSFEKGLDFYCFTIDGRSHKKHTKPLLNFISRKEEKIELSADEIENAIHKYKPTKAVLIALGFKGE